jgi:integrase
MWEVRWRAAGVRHSRSFKRKRDAELLEDETRRRKRLGTLAEIDAGQQMLQEFVKEWWRVHARPNLEPSTRRRYAQLWDSHILDRLGGYRLRELTPRLVENFRADLYDAGVGEPTILKALTLLQGVLRVAVVRGELPHNPVPAVQKPSQATRREVRPLPPEMVEAIRALLGLRDATLISLHAYGGLRPGALGEALRLRWEDVRERTLLVYAPKTRRERTVPLLAQLQGDLAEWRLACGRPPPETLLFSRPDGSPWREHDYRNWRKRSYAPAAHAAGASSRRPYDLRHSYVSLLIHEGLSIVEVARRAGHSPQTCLSTYAHVFAEFDPAERISAEEAVRRARARAGRARDAAVPSPSGSGG